VLVRYVRQKDYFLIRPRLSGHALHPGSGCFVGGCTGPERCPMLNRRATDVMEGREKAALTCAGTVEFSYKSTLSVNKNFCLAFFRDRAADGGMPRGSSSPSRRSHPTWRSMHRLKTDPVGSCASFPELALPASGEFLRDFRPARPRGPASRGIRRDACSGDSRGERDS
jgi:hypothetical protein